MQSQMSTVPSMVPKPSAPAAAPQVVHGAPKPPRKSTRWLIVPGLVLLAGLGWWLWQRSQAASAQQSTPAAVTAVRTATVTTGDVVRSLRLTGTTGAEKFASLLVPQLRGSRAESLREGRTFQSPGANYNISSNAGSTGGGIQAGSAPSSGSGGSGESQVASTAGSTGGGSAALRSATSRVPRGGGGGASARSGGGGAATGGSSSAGGDLGSTASALQGTGFGGGGGSSSSGGGGGGSRGGGGGSEFSLVLQSASKGGTFVKKGDVVAEFDRQYMMNRLEDYRSAYSQMEASFKKLKAEVDMQLRAHAQSIDTQRAVLEKARLDLKTLPVMGVIDSERIKLAAEEADAKHKQLLAEVKHVRARYDSQVKVAELELKQAKIELERAELNADRMIMKAPIDGLVVMQTMFRSGEMAQIQAGDQLYPGMRFMQIVDPSSMVVNASVNQVDADTIRVGAKAKVRFDAFPGLELPATVHAIGAMTRPGGMRAQFVKEIPVVLKLDRLDPRVIPDLSVSVDVEVETEKQVATVPLGSVFQAADGGAPFVFVKNGNAWERREVQLGISSNVATAVRSGLRPGEVVAAEYPPAETRKEGQG
jgi:HlyD family secretion protein